VKANVKEIRFPNNFNPAEAYILSLLDIILANSDGVKLTLIHKNNIALFKRISDLSSLKTN
jgi:hypothetical protein